MESRSLPVLQTGEFCEARSRGEEGGVLNWDMLLILALRGRG